MSPKSSLTLYAIGVLGALLLCSMTALLGYQLGLDEGMFVAESTAPQITVEASSAAPVAAAAVKSSSTDGVREPIEEPAVVVAKPAPVTVTGDSSRELKKKLEQKTEDLAVLAAENRKLAAEISRLTSEVDAGQRNRVELESLVDGLKHQLNIDKTAYADLKVSLKASSEDMTSLRDELNFYRNILSPDESGSGVQIDLFSVHELDVPRRFQYELTLIQMQHHDQPMVGEIDVAIEGTEDGIRRIVDVAIFGSAPPPSLSFKYYQRVAGEFDLPESFSPSGVTVSFKATDGRAIAVDQSYPWPETIGDAGTN